MNSDAILFKQLSALAKAFGNLECLTSPISGIILQLVTVLHSAHRNEGNGKNCTPKICMPPEGAEPCGDKSMFCQPRMLQLILLLDITDGDTDQANTMAVIPDQIEPPGNTMAVDIPPNLLSGEKMNCCILDKLKFGMLRHKEPIKKEITIVKRR
ncbi:hypothetical protein BTVI_129012 [Pitangus sulphuratus]|nr:hypothetical protein BTVI_129012 [Pitangus sulphuratus]